MNRQEQTDLQEKLAEVQKKIDHLTLRYKRQARPTPTEGNKPSSTDKTAKFIRKMPEIENDEVKVESMPPSRPPPRPPTKP